MFESNMALKECRSWRCTFLPNLLEKPLSILKATECFYSDNAGEVQRLPETSMLEMVAQDKDTELVPDTAAS